MRVDQAEIVISAVAPSQYPDDGLPEIALSGRSNVGKSSLINKLINRKKLARTSSKPGKTQTLNFYRINEMFYFVDVPGYGYAQVSKTERAKWGKFVEQYMLNRESLKIVLLIIDIRHAPSKDDQAMYDWIVHHDLPVCVVATKADKISKSQLQKHIKIVKETLLLRADHPLVLFSSETGLGKEELWKIISTAVDGKKDDEFVSET